MKPENYPNSILWDVFYTITRIPRPSHKEQKIITYITDLAKKHGLDYHIDSANNLVVYLPASQGYENHATVIIQNHMDMVTQHAPDRIIDFDNDAIEIYVEDGFLKADRTTLGADNGIGMAAAIATILDQTILHPPLELLFTSAEETGLYGATDMDIKAISGKKMLNLDTEEWGELYIGCTGGQVFTLEKDLETTNPDENKICIEINLGHLSGGHSGIQIHEQRGNAIQLLAQFLMKLDCDISAFEGGTAHNVIPRGAKAIVYINDLQEVETLAKLFIKETQSYLPKADHNFSIAIQKLAKYPFIFTKSSKAIILQSIYLLPHGAQRYSLEQPTNLVNVSANAAVVKTEQEKLTIITSIRFFNQQEAEYLNQQIHTIAQVLNMHIETKVAYPGWQPIYDNPLLELAIQIYNDLYQQKPAIKAIHAGLECGILKGKKPDLDIISFGPTIKGAHSPTERVEIESVNGFYEYFKALLKNL